MNYQSIYDAFIADRLAKEPQLIASQEYKERHHVIPVALGGRNGKINTIYLTARDHYFAHCCLAKVYGGKMWSALFAVAAMTKTDPSSGYFLRGRMVAIARARAANIRSESMKRLWASGEFKRNRIYAPMDEATKAKISAAGKGRKKSKDSIKKAIDTKRASANVFKFFRVDAREQFIGTQSEFVSHTGIDQSLASCLTVGKIKSAKGWMLQGGNPLTIRRRDGTIRQFRHKDGRVFVGTGYQFRTQFGLDPGVVCNLIGRKNNVSSFKGWGYIGEESNS